MKPGKAYKISGAMGIGILLLFVLIHFAAVETWIPQIAGKPSVQTSDEIPEAVKSLIVDSYGKLPLSFEANQGQTDSRVEFLSRGSGYTLLLTPTEAVLSLKSAQRKTSEETDVQTATTDPEDRQTAPPAVLRMGLLGANPVPQMLGLDKLPGKSNYFIGNDLENWHTDVPHYARVHYDDVYPGVDLVFYGNQRQLEYDFIVSPGADPAAIRLGFKGADNLSLDGSGNLTLHMAEGDVLQKAPIVYQEVDGARRAISGSYVLQGEDQVSFQVAAYDASRPLIIDPILSYSTYLGGSLNDDARGIAVDASGNAYVTGTTRSVDFPTGSPLDGTLGGSADAFVTKLNASGSAIVYSTYLGGSGNDGARQIALDPSGNAYVTGSTSSADFPTVSAFDPTLGGSDDAYVTKLNTAGSALVYSTYLGGSGSDGGGDIIVDASGNAFVVGFTNSIDLPTVNPFQAVYGGGFWDAFVTKLNATGSALVYSTYLGGSLQELGVAIAIDGSGNAYVTDQTISPDFPLMNPFQATSGGGFDAYVTKLNAAGSGLVYSTLLGGGGFERVTDIVVDASGNAYLTGITGSTDFPTVGSIQAYGGGGDAFVTKLNTAGSALVYSTYLGGTGQDRGLGIVVGAFGNAFVSGRTRSTDFPTVSAFQAVFGGGTRDAFVTKLPLSTPPTWAVSALLT